MVGCFPGADDSVFEIEAVGVLAEELLLRKFRQDVGGGDSGIGFDVGESFGNGMVRGLEEEDAAFGAGAIGVFEFAIAVTATGGLGEGVETALGAVNEGKADIDAGLNELGGDENEWLTGFSEFFRVLQDGDHVGGAHAGREVQNIGFPAECLVEGLSGFGGIEDEEAAGGSVLEDVDDESLIVERTEILAGDAF